MHQRSVLRFGSAALGIAATALGQAQFVSGVPVSHWADADYPQVTAVDLDGDGRLDLFVDGADEATGYFAQDRFGGFLPRSLPFSVSPTGCALGDFDGDGSIDVYGARIVVAGLPMQGLALNDGSGGFRSVSAPVTAGGDPVAIDVDRDGDLDIVRADFTRSQILVFDNDGRGQLAVPRAVRPQFAVALRTSDFDGDGVADLVPLGGPPVVMLGDGAGGFPGTLAFPSGTERFLEVVPADFDGDGAPDLFVRTWSRAGALFVQRPGGFVDASASLPPLVGVQGGTALDADGDGDSDLWVIADAGQRQVLLLNDGSGGFVDASASRIARPAIPVGASVATAADLDGDGDLDIVEADRTMVRTVRNRLRDLAADAPVRGRPWTITAALRPGFASDWSLALGAIGPPRVPIVLPGIGAWHLDPASSLPLPVLGLFAPAGEAAWRIPVPADAALAGVEVAAQAVLVPRIGSLSFSSPVRAVLR